MSVARINKKILPSRVLIIIFCLSFSIFSPTKPFSSNILDDKGILIKIMSFNVLDGGRDRNDEWVDPILEENPDIIVINEAASWKSKDLITHYTNKLNEYHWPTEQNYSGRVTNAGGNTAIAIFSRFYFKNFEILLLGTDNRECAHASFIIEDENVHIFGIHLKSGATEDDRNRRESQTDSLVEEINKLPSKDTIFVMGDFNSYSPVDIANETIEPNWDYSPTYTEDQAGTYPMETLLSMEFVDTFRVTNPIDPGWTIFDTHPDANYTAFGRIDYQLVTINKINDLNGTRRIYDPLRSVTWSDHAPLVGGYWFGEKPPVNESFTSTMTKDSSFQFNSRITNATANDIPIIFSILIIVSVAANIHRKKVLSDKMKVKRE
jgi:exonuclease III